ncbi:hypothetical protein ACJMK2_029451, partial [Sinanodonta woodiana]
LEPFVLHPQAHKSYYIDSFRKGPNPVDRNAVVEQRLDTRLRTPADGASYRRHGRTSSYYKHFTKSGFYPSDLRYEPYNTSSNERLGISTDQDLHSSIQTEITNSTTSDTANNQRVSIEQLCAKCKSPSGGRISDNNSRNRKNKYFRRKDIYSAHSTSHKEHK